MPRRILAQKVLRQDQDILAALAQGGDRQQHHRQAVVEVRTEASLRHLHAQLRLRGGDEFDVELATLHGPQPSHALLLDGAEELALEQQRQCIDLVQEQRAVRRASNRPGLARLASVKAPASKPNNSASSSVSGMAAQLTSMKGPWARGPLSWMTRATSPLPVPVSPCSNSVGTTAFPTASKAARWRICVRKAWMTGAWPTMRSVGWACGTGSDCAMTASHSMDGRVTVVVPLLAPGGYMCQLWLRHCRAPRPGKQAQCLAGTRRATMCPPWHGFCSRASHEGTVSNGSILVHIPETFLGMA